MRVIYDFRSNNGDDIPYYVIKRDLVVAVEANPTQAADIRIRFSREIAQGRLMVLNCVLVKEASAGRVPYYVHRTEHVLSQYPRSRDQHARPSTAVHVPIPFRRAFRR